MTSGSEWRGTVGNVWAAEWRRTDRALAELSRKLDAAILTAAPTGPVRAVDIGSGAGATTLALAGWRRDATVLGIDLSAALVAVAAERQAAAAIGSDRVSFQTGDAIAVATCEAPFDLAYSRHGVMFFDDPVNAFERLRTAIRPGGALVVSCFAEPAANGFATPLAEALGVPAPQAGPGPGPFAFSNPAAVERLLTTAGWNRPQGRRVPFRYVVGEGAEPITDAVSFLSRIGPAASALRNADPNERARLIDRLRDYLSQYEAEGSISLPATAWLWSAIA